MRLFIPAVCRNGKRIVDIGDFLNSCDANLCDKRLNWLQLQTQTQSCISCRPF